MDEKERRQIEEDDRRYVWHPFTQMQDYEKEVPVVIERAQGVYLFDIHGKRYLDGVSSLWVNVHGHRKSEIDAAVVEQVGKVAHTTLLGLSNIPAIELAKKLVAITPDGLEKVFYSDSGSTAVEIALKISFQYFQQKGGRLTSKKKFIALTNAYHGDTIGSVSVGGIPIFHQIFGPLLFQCRFVPAPYCYRCPLDKDVSSCEIACVNELEETVKKHHEETAALIIEPLVQGAAGMLVAPDGYLSRVRELCNRYNILLIADEVATGFGRTGSLFACDQEKVAPDILCLAKGMTGGYLPLAATLTTQEIYEAFLGEYEDCKTFFHGHTYTGNPLASAAALANISLLDPVEVLPGLKTRIEILSEALKPLKDLQHAGDIRQKGFMVGIELVRSKKTKEPYPMKEKIGHRVMLAAREKGMIIRPLGNVIVLMPPLCMEEEEIEKMAAITEEAIREVTE